MEQYQLGTTATLYVNFLTLDGKEASSVVDPKITIRHINSSNVLVVDVDEAALTYAVETMYFYKWVIPEDADLGEYTVEYQATVDGEYAEANESVQVIPTQATPVVTPCAPYTTEAKVAEYLGVAESSIKDYWLDWATSYIETYTCQKFCPKTTTEYVDIEDPHQEIIFLDNFPVINVTELKDDGEVIPPTDYLVYNDIGKIAFRDEFTGTRINLLQPGPFTYGRQRVEVTYTFGHSTVPKEIVWAATVLAASIAISSLKQSGTISGGAVLEEEIGEYRVRRSEDQSASFELSIEGSKEVNDRLVEDVFSAKNVLRLYRCKRMRVV